MARIGKFFVGTDLGQKIDPSAVAIVEKRGQDVYVLQVTAFEPGTVFSQVTGYLNLLNQRLQNVARVYIDETGVGGFFVQDAIKAGLKNAVGVFLSLPMKQQIMDYLKRLMQDCHLHLQRDPDLINEMSGERYELSKTGQLQFSHPSGTHDDRLWALALAVYASRHDPPEYHPVAVTGRMARFGLPRHKRPDWTDWVRKLQPGAV